MNYSLDWLSTDGKLLLTVRILRTSGYGFLSVVIAIYLRFLGFYDIHIGLLLGLTLVNSVIFTIFASFYADRISRRRVLVVYVFKLYLQDQERLLPSSLLSSQLIRLQGAL